MTSNVPVVGNMDFWVRNNGWWASLHKMMGSVIFFFGFFLNYKSTRLGAKKKVVHATVCDTNIFAQYFTVAGCLVGWLTVLTKL